MNKKNDFIKKVLIVTVLTIIIYCTTFFTSVFNIVNIL